MHMFSYGGEELLEEAVGVLKSPNTKEIDVFVLSSPQERRVVLGVRKLLAVISSTLMNGGSAEASTTGDGGVRDFYGEERSMEGLITLLGLLSQVGREVDDTRIKHLLSEVGRPNRGHCRLWRNGLFVLAKVCGALAIVATLLMLALLLPHPPSQTKKRKLKRRKNHVIYATAIVEAYAPLLAMLPLPPIAVLPLPQRVRLIFLNLMSGSDFLKKIKDPWKMLTKHGKELKILIIMLEGLEWR
ncbi:hypothetical protein PIB30_035277 [Stylosanthes scabra]|uniref:Uncharacterized protein n=1 Tax=Stylosanthes scabra TaxID=79078 RepID=A0ABU6XB47_9FABA|nr:hypothetical protein [Stylosanthes scabra]